MAKTKWVLKDGSHKVKSSGDFISVLNATTRTSDGIIYFGKKPVWVQVPEAHPELFPARS